MVISTAGSLKRTCFCQTAPIPRTHKTGSTSGTSLCLPFSILEVFTSPQEYYREGNRKGFNRARCFTDRHLVMRIGLSLLEWSWRSHLGGYDHHKRKLLCQQYLSRNGHSLVRYDKHPNLQEARVPSTDCYGRRTHSGAFHGAAEIQAFPELDST